MSSLDTKDYQEASEELCVATPKVKAVADIESRGSGFFDNGEPKILYEAHIFSDETEGQFDESHPNISSPYWDRSLYEGGKAEHDRLQKAVELDREAALKSASWGKFQILGRNFSVCGYDSLQDFINAMYRSEKGHLEAFTGFIQNQGLDEPLREEDWESFAAAYNGSDFRKNAYHIKLKEAYEKFS